jgi:hypothetical protein
MEQLRNELYPFLRVHLTDAQIDGRAHGNRRPLTVDEKLAIGLMTAGGCPLGGILWVFCVGRACAASVITKFFEAVVFSRVGEIKFPSTLHELQATANAWLSRGLFNPIYYGHIGALDGLAVRVLPTLSLTLPEKVLQQLTVRPLSMHTTSVYTFQF